MERPFPRLPRWVIVWFRRNAKGAVAIVDEFARAVGRALRQERERNRLTLREVQRISEGFFTASGVGGYERGERMISLYRFCRLADVYGARPDRLLMEIFGVRQELPWERTDVAEGSFGGGRAV